MIASKQTTLYEIQLEGKFVNTGIGFSCMKKALEMNISGQLKYMTNTNIQILVQGEEIPILEYYDWCIHTNETAHGSCQKSSIEPIELNDFTIINTI